MADRPWRGTSGGGTWGTAAIRLVATWGGRDLCYLAVTLPALWHTVVNGPARRATIAYHRRLQPGLGLLAAWLRTFHHFHVFARGLADRMLLVLSPGCLAFTEEGHEHLARGLAHPQGCLLLSAHLGSFDLAGRWLLQRVPSARPLHLVMLDAEDPRVRRQLDLAMGDRPYHVIDLRDPAGAALEMAAALQRGEWCALLGDRTAGDPAATAAVPFLGGQARFPTGPFHIAAMTGAVILPVFCVRTGWARWRITAHAPWQVEAPPRAGRQAAFQAWTARWAALLETEVRRSPLAWNNYFSVWEEPGNAG